MAIAFKADKEAAANDSAYPVAPDGEYYLTCVEATERKAKSGRDMIEMELVICEGEYEERVRIWNYLTFIEAGAKGHGMTLHALKAFGIDADGDVEITADMFKGVSVKAELGQETYNGKLKNVIKKFITDDVRLEEVSTVEAEPEPVVPALAVAAAKAGLIKPKPAAPAPAARKPPPWGKK